MRTIPSRLGAIPVLLAVFLVSSGASAQRELLNPMGGKGTLAIDQISGFRASAISGVSYAGPIGVSYQRLSEANFDGRGNDVQSLTTFWLTPSADFFVIDHLSVGGLIEFATTGGSIETPGPGNTTNSVSLATTTNLTFLPRVGWLFGVTDRFGIWPRAGLGYAQRQTVPDPANNPNIRDTQSGAVFDIDVGFLYRLNETFFIRAAPDLVLSLGGSHSTTIGGVTTSADASIVQFSVVAGIGVFLDL